MITVRIDEDDFLEMLLDRCNAWETSKENIDLFEKMYQNSIYGGCFEDIELNINSIVDNDVVNYCSVIHKNDYKKDFKKLLKLYKNGEYDISCEDFEEISPSFIEAVSDDEDRILVRY